MDPHVKDRARAWAAEAVGRLIVLFAQLLTGLRAIGFDATRHTGPTLYFANHTSHGDFVLLWATLPPWLRAVTRPVAGEDYWMASKLRAFIGRDVFRALMIRRDGSGAGGNPVEQMAEALGNGDSLIMFPEGTRNTTEETLLPLKSGLYHLARACPDVHLVPVWIENLKRVLPKGKLLPVPLACTLRYGPPLVLGAGEDKADFLARARQALLDMRPEYDRDPPPAPPSPPAPPAAAPVDAPLPALPAAAPTSSAPEVR
ncbi:lysophospholipid acyltransferase family protein [uncultured Xylophilus sp.]|uniref:lysophospholipid acyltransferase family protein n=1 Tax=uncultured Xylophilus sp. TaxID=296832 RepID=UPI003452A0F4